MKHLRTAILMTVVTTVLLGVIYPLAVTGIVQVLFPDKANGQLLRRDGALIGSRIIGQPFTGAEYFHSRPAAAGDGYDAANSGGSNLSPTNQKLLDRIHADVEQLQAENPNTPVPVDLVTTSASGLDPDISPAAAYFQVPRIAHARGMSEDQVRRVIQEHIRPRQLRMLGEPRINVLELNLDLDRRFRP
jgi:K+-transporting ATPase ATPase C chain